MKLYGYEHDTEREEPSPLREVTIVADPATLVRLADFLLEAARKMELHGERYGHEHFEDFAKEMRGGPALVVVRDR